MFCYKTIELISGFFNFKNEMKNFGTAEPLPTFSI
jgi:hypothetical protein